MRDYEKGENWLQERQERRNNNSENLKLGQYGVASVGGHKTNCKCSFCTINKGNQQTLRRFLHGRSDKPKRLMNTNYLPDGRKERASWKTINGNRIMTGGSYYENPHGSLTGGQKKQFTNLSYFKPWGKSGINTSEDISAMNRPTRNRPTRTLISPDVTLYGFPPKVMNNKALYRIKQMRSAMNNDLLKLNENNPQDKRQVETLRINIAELDKTIKNNT